MTGITGQASQAHGTFDKQPYSTIHYNSDAIKGIQVLPTHKVDDCDDDGTYPRRHGKFFSSLVLSPDLVCCS